MSQVSKSRTGLWATVVSVVLLVTIAIWQFYLYVTFKGTNGILDAQGGHGHLWLALIATVFACFAAFIIFSAFLSYDRDNEMHITQ